MRLQFSDDFRGYKVHQFTQIRFSLEEKFGNTISTLVLRSHCSLWTWTFFSSLYITFPQKSKYLFQIHKRGSRTRSVDRGSWSTVFNIDVQWVFVEWVYFSWRKITTFLYIFPLRKLKIFLFSEILTKNQNSGLQHWQKFNISDVTFYSALFTEIFKYGSDRKLCKADIPWNIRVKVFKNGASKIFGRKPLKNLKWYGLPKQTIPRQIFKRLSSTNFAYSILE